MSSFRLIKKKNQGKRKNKLDYQAVDFSALPKLLTIKQVCELFKVHPNTVRNWDKNEKLKAVRLGSRQDRRYEREAVKKLYLHMHPAKRTCQDDKKPKDNLPEPEEGKYVIQPGFSFKKIKLLLVSKQFTVFVYSAVVVAVVFLTIQVGFFAYVYTIQAEERPLEIYKVTLAPAHVEGWENSKAARTIDALSASTISEFTEKNSAVFKNQPVKSNDNEEEPAIKENENTKDENPTQGETQPEAGAEEISVDDLDNPYVLGDETTLAQEIASNSIFTASDFQIPDDVPEDAIFKKSTLIISFAADSYPANEDVVTFEYSLDKGDSWNTIDSFALLANVSNASNEGYWETVLDISTREDVGNVEARVKYSAVPGTQTAIAYLDGMALELELEEPNPIIAEIKESVTIENDSLKVDEEPVIDIEVEEEAFFSFLGADPTSRTVKNVEVIDPSGQVIAADFEIKDIKEGSTTTTEYALKTDDFKQPGSYQIKFTIEQDGVVEEVVEDFTWGVLAINPDQSIYQTGQEALFSIGILDDNGDMVCDADVILTITNPDGAVETRTTRDGSIIISENCRHKGDFRGPDYYTDYLPSVPGQYALSLEATHQNGTRTIDDGFEAQLSPTYTIKRYGPTRVFPYIFQPMSLTVTAYEDFAGEIIEVVPDFFEIETVDDAITRQVPQGGKTVTEIVWNRTLAEGQSTELIYNFKTPEESPALYLVGPARVGGWDEGRQWQMAIDVTYMYLLANTASAATGWTDDTATFDSDFLRGAATFSATGGGSATHTHTIHHNNVSAESAAGGTTCSRRCGWVATTAHTHTSSNPTVGNADNDPANHTFYVWKNDTGVASTIPDNTFAFFDSDPGGSWTRFSSADGRLVKFDNSHTTGGSDTHTHSVTWQSLAASSGSINELDPLTGSDAAADAHTHTAPSAGTTASATSIPQYVTTLIFEQTNATAQAIPSNFIGLFDGDPGSGWNVISDGAAEDYYERFIRGHATTEGTKTGSNTHTHTDTTSGASGPPSSSPSGSGGTGYAGGSHTHTITTGYNSADHTPPYVDFVIAQCDGCGAVTIDLSGTAYQEDESTAIDGGSINKTVTLWVNGSAAACGGGACTDEITTVDGAWAITGITAVSGDIITIFLDDETEEGTTVFKSDGTTQTNVDIYQNAVIVRNDTGTSITNANLESGDRESGDSDVKFDVVSNNVTFDTDFELHVWTGDTYDPGGTVTTQGTGGDLHVDDSAIMYLDTATNTISAEITVDTSATLNVQQTTNVNGTGVAVDVTGTLNHTAATFTIGNSADEDMRVNSGGAVTLSGGTTDVKDILDLDGGTTTVSNIFTIGDDIDIDGGTLNVDAGADIDVVDQILMNLAASVIDLDGGSLDSGNFWQIYGGTLNLDGGDHNIGSAGYLYLTPSGAALDFSMTGGEITTKELYVHSAGTFNQTSVTGGTINVGLSGQTSQIDINQAAQFWNITVEENTDSQSEVLIDILNDLTINSGKTLTGNDDTYEINNLWDNQGGTFTAGTSTVTLTDTDGGLKGSGDTTFYNLTIDTCGACSVHVGSAGGTDDPTVTNTLTVTNGEYLDIASGRVVTVASTGSIADTTGGFVGSGRLTFKPASGFPTNLWLASALTVRFDSTDNGQTVPADTWAPIFEVYGNNTSNTVTAAAGTFTFQQNVSLIQDGTGETIFDMGTNDPTVTMDKDLDIGANAEFQSTSGTLNLAGDFIKTGDFKSSNGTVVFNGTSPQTINAVGSMVVGEQFYSATFTNTSGTDPDTDPGIIFTGGSVDFLGTVTMTTQGVYFRFAAGNDYRIHYRLDIDGQAADGIYFRSSSGGSQYEFEFWDVSSQGYSIEYLNVKDADACGGTTSPLDVTDGTSTNAGNNNCWDFGPIDVSGTIYSDTGSSQYDCSADNLTVRVMVDGVGDYTGICTSGIGEYTVADVNLANQDDIVTIFLDDETPNATIVVRIDNETDNLTGMDLYQNNLITRHEDAGPVTNTDLDQYDSGGDSDVVFTVTTSNLTVSSGSGLYVWGGDTFTPGGTVTTTATATTAGSAGDIVIGTSAEMDMETYALSIGGDFDVNGTFTDDYDTTMTFTATGLGFTISPNGTVFENVVFNGSGGGWSFDATTTINYDLTVTDGTLSGTNDFNIDDNVTGDGIINLTGGTFKIINGANNFGGDTGWTFSTLMFDHSGDIMLTTTATGSGSITVTDQLYIDATPDVGCDCDHAHKIEAGSKTWILSGSGTDASRPYFVYRSGAGLPTHGLIPQTSTFRFTGTANTDIEIDNYYNLELRPSGGSSPTYDFKVNGTINVDNNYTIGDGTNDITVTNANDRAVDLEGDFSCTAGASTNTVTTGTGTWTVGGDFNLTNCDSFTVTSGHTLVMDGTGGLTSSSKTLYDFETSGSGTITINDTTAISNDVVVGSGTTLTGSASVTVNGGDITGDGTVNMTGGTISLSSTGNFGGDTGWTFNNLSFIQSGCGAMTTTATGSGSIIVNGVLTTTSCFSGDDFDHQLNSGAKTWIITGTGTPVVSNGGIVGGTSTFRYTGNGATSIDAPNGPQTNGSYYNLELKPSGTATYTLPTSSDFDINNNLVIGDGTNTVTVDGTSNNPVMDIGGSVSCAGTGTNNVNTGTGTWTVTGDVNLTNCNVTATSGHTLEMDGGGVALTADGNTLYNFNTTGSGAISLSDALITTNDISIGGTTTVTTSSDVTVNGGDLSGTGDFDASGGTVILLDDGTVHGSSSDWTFSNLTLNQAAACSGDCGPSCHDTTTMSGSGDMTVSGTLLSDTCMFFVGENYYRSHALSPGSQTVIMSGSGQPFQADLIYGTSTVRYTGTSATVVGFFTSAIYNEFYNLELQPSGSNPTYTLDSDFSGGAMEVHGNLTIGDGINNSTFDSTIENALLDVGGNFTCTNGAANTVNTGTGTWTVTGDLDLSDCTLTATSGHTFEMDGSSKSITPGSQTIYNFKESGTGSITQVGAMDVNGIFDLADTAAFTQAANNNLNVAGNFTLASGTTFTAASGMGKLIFDGDLTYDDSTSPQQDVGNVEIGTSPDTTNLASDMVAKTLTINDGDILYTNGYDLNIGAGGITIAADGGAGGGLLDVDDDVETDGTVMETDGKFDLQTGGTLANSGGTTVGSLLKFTMPAAAADVTNDLITAGTGTLYDLEVDDGAGTYNLIIEVEDPVDVDRNITITNGYLDVVSGENNAITIGGAWNNDDVFTCRSGTVTFDATSATAGTMTIDSTGAGTDDFYNIVFNDAGGGDTFQLESSLDVNNNLTITGGTLDVKTVENNSINIGGNWVNSDIFTAQSGTVTFDGTTTGHTINPGSSSFYKVVFDGSGGAWSPLTNTMTATNDLIMKNGTFDTVTGTADVTVNGNVQCDTTCGTINMTSTNTFKQSVSAAKSFGTNVAVATNWAFYNLTLDSSANTPTITINATGTGEIGVNNNFTTTNNGTSLIVDNETNDRILDVVNVSLGAGTTIQASSTADFKVAGNWANNGDFTDGTGTVTVDGTGQQTFSGQMTGASDRFYNLTITNAGASNPDVIFSGSADAANNFVANAASTQLQFNAASTYTFNNIVFNGQAEGTRVFLRSSSTGTQWNLTSTGTQSVSNTNVRDSNACGGDTIDATDGTNFDATNNDCWDFNTLSFSISDVEIGFGDLSPSTGRWATDSEPYGDNASDPATPTAAHTLSVATNSDNGWAITYYGTTLTSGSNTIDVASVSGDSDGTPGQEEFGISASTDGNCTIAAGYLRDATADFAFAVSTPTTLASESIPTSTETISVSYLANITGTTEAGDYSTSITYIVTATF